MSRIVIVGGGIVGLSTAMMLVERGHDVVVCERDPHPVPGSAEEAWETWERRGVAQFRQPHYLHPGGREILDERLPDVKESLLAAGAITMDTLGQLPPMITDREPRVGDERFITVTARRPIIEYAVARAADKLVDVRRGVGVAGLTSRDETGVPHVTGVRLDAGETLPADLVIDAMGRRSVLPEWLTQIGARAPYEDAEDCGFTYYTRYFRGSRPQIVSGGLTPYESFSILTLYGDAETWSVTVFISSRDTVLKSLREAERWNAVVAACPLQAHWLQGEVTTEVEAMAGIIDRSRRLVVDGSPVATGVVAVGDAYACTNPSLGRGITMGLIHAAATADVAGVGDAQEVARAHDAVTQERLMPWYRDSVLLDRARLAEVDAAIDGRPAPPPDPSPRFGLMRAMLWDAELFRGFLEITGLLATPEEVRARAGFVERIAAVNAAHEPFAMPGPSREELVRIAT
ncbi:MAG: FAD-dependent oxidoreductase [Actinobacteria bacterium]|nr:FAD-dependent oxidoreductase [Actinomycetota bacterium]